MWPQGRRNACKFEGANHKRTTFDRFLTLYLIRKNLGGPIWPIGSDAPGPSECTHALPPTTV